MVRRCIEAYDEDAPSAYAIDLGLVPGGGTIVVEVNDALALQSYGLAPVAYAGLIQARWDELVGGGS